jgi:hypothetical protein
MNFSQLSHRLKLGSMLLGDRIKSYSLIKCDELHLLTDTNDKIHHGHFLCY